MVLIDWTRMGRSYCLAGALLDKVPVRIVRPLLSRGRGLAAPNIGWSAYLLDGHARWEIFELVGMESYELPHPPHTEDCWVATLRPRKRSLPPQERRKLLEQTVVDSSSELFGAPFVHTQASAYVRPGEGERSLTTVVVPSRSICFSAVTRAGAAEPDYRASVPVPGQGQRSLPVKDHHLLLRAERAARDVDARVRFLEQAIAAMGDEVAVRLGLSRAFPGRPNEAAACWLMADGFFSLTDPQP
jgi:hypothetical protein